MPDSLARRTLKGHQTVTLSLLFAAGVVNFIDRSSLSIANTTVRAEMHLNATQMGWLLSAFSLAYGVAQVPLIGLLDRIGTRAVLGAGLIVWSAAQLLTGFVRGMPMFLGLRVLLGIGEAPFYPSGVRSTREWFTAATRGRAVAVLNSSATIGTALAPPALTALMLWLGWRSMFMLLGAAGLVVAIGWIWLHRARRDTPLREPETGSAGIARGAWKVLIRQRTVWGMMLGWGGVNYTVYHLAITTFC